MCTRSSIKLIFCLFIIFTLPELLAQQKEFDEVRIADFFQYDQSYDSTSPAIVLFDVAKVFFDGDLNVIMDRHTRLKILNESGLEYGDVEIAFNREHEQKVNNIKAATYTVQNGALKVQKVENRDVFETNLYDKIFVKKFSMPGMESGSIIDYSYRKIMGNPFYMPDWKFHREIPVEYSSIYMEIPWRLNYHMVFKGTDTLYTTNSGNFNHAGEKGYFVEVTKTDLPPVEALPFMDSRENFISEVYTQLNYAYTDRRNKIEYLKDWKEVVDEIKRHPDIGKQKANGEIKDKVKQLIVSTGSEQDIIERIFEFVSTSMVWNNLHRVYSEKGIRDTFKEKSGSSGDINLLLYEMLQEAGIKVHYALTSTRDHGHVLIDYPIVNQFNNILTVAEANGRIYILDATEGYRSLLLPPVKDLYQIALVIRDKGFGWIETKPFKQTVSKEFLNYRIDDNGKVKGDFTSTSIGYKAQRLRQEVQENSKNETVKNRMDDLENLHIDSVLVRGMDMTDNTAVFYSQFSFELFEGDSLKAVNYLNPLLFLADTNNPFDKATREFPVYFPYPVSETKNVKVTIPNGYYVDEMPESVSIMLPDNEGSFKFEVNSEDSVIKMSSNFILQKPFYKENEYQQLREMFIKLAESHSAAVVLKRTETNE